jgi:predicted nucleic acid-binding protein
MSRHGALLLDACVTINLVAAGPVEHIAQAIGRQFLVTRQAAAEVGHLRDITDGQTRLVPVELSRHVRAGAFEIIDATARERELTVQLAGLVGDGEASTIAVALGRSLPVATDDRKARRVCAEHGLPEPTGTATLVRQYCEASAFHDTEVRWLLGRIRGRASFQPRRTDPELAWWHDHEPARAPVMSPPGRTRARPALRLLPGLRA